MSVMFSQEKKSILSQRFYCASLWCYNELLVSSDWSVRGGGGLGKDSCLTRQQLLGKKNYFCLAVDLRLSVLQPLETPSACHPSIPPPTHSSLYRCLPGSYAYLPIMLQGCSSERCLAEELDDNTVGPNCSQMACITRCFQESTIVELFSPGSRFLAFFGTDSRDCLDSH